MGDLDRRSPDFKSGTATTRLHAASSIANISDNDVMGNLSLATKFRVFVSFVFIRVC